MHPLIDGSYQWGSSVTGSAKFDFAVGQPNLYLMMRFKQELVAAHGLAHGFDLFTREFRFTRNAAAREANLETERVFAEQQGLFFSETAPAGEPFVHEPPMVYGNGNHRPVAGVTRSRYVACLPDAHIRGRSSVIRVDGHWLLDVEDDEALRLDDELAWDPQIFAGVWPRPWMIDLGDAGEALQIREGFSLLGSHTDFFGHWMCEYLPKYAAARQSGTLPDVPVLIDAHMPSSHRTSLECLYAPSSIIEVPAFTPLHVARLWSAPTLSYFPLHEVRNDRFTWDAVSAAPSRLEPIIIDWQRRFDALHHPSTFGTRVYLARKPSRHRRLSNADEIEEVARDMEFEVLYPEDMDFLQQAALLRGAQHVVAPEGSAIFLAVFARPETALLILSHPLTDVLADYNGLLGAHGIQVSALTGPITEWNRNTPHDSHYSIDPVAFRSLTANILRRPVGR